MEADMRTEIINLVKFLRKLAFTIYKSRNETK